jgi:hypothetical protein
LGLFPVRPKTESISFQRFSMAHQSTVRAVLLIRQTASAFRWKLSRLRLRMTRNEGRSLIPPRELRLQLDLGGLQKYPDANEYLWKKHAKTPSIWNWDLIIELFQENCHQAFKYWRAESATSGRRFW